MNCQIVGGGSWGLALARLLALNGQGVRLWCREEDGFDELRRTRQSPLYLAGVSLPESVEVSHELDSEADLVVLAVPSHAMRTVLTDHPLPVSPEAILVSVAKGIENDTLLTMTEVIRDVTGRERVVALSGPSHAEEVARDLPASVVVGGRDVKACDTVQQAFMAPTFRVYTSADVIGVELGGALKNVVAIAAGVCDGFQLGDNAKAALITRGLAEVARLGAAMGADPMTFAGLSGMGDLIVTCESRLSRNRWVGEQIAQRRSLEEITSSTPMVAEGVRTTRSACALASRQNVEMPITQQVYDVLFGGGDPRDAVSALMMRDAKPERGC